MIYFLTTPDRSRIKIGTTIRLSSRLRQLAVEHGNLEVLAVVDGSFPEEKALHRRFAHLRNVGEWFEPGDDLLGFIVSDGKPWDGSDEADKTLSTKLHMDVIESARIVAAYRNVQITDLLSDILRPVLVRMEQEETAKRAKSRGKGE